MASDLDRLIMQLSTRILQKLVDPEKSKEFSLFVMKAFESWTAPWLLFGNISLIAGNAKTAMIAYLVARKNIMTFGASDGKILNFLDDKLRACCFKTELGPIFTAEEIVEYERSKLPMGLLDEAALCSELTFDMTQLALDARLPLYVRRNSQWYKLPRFFPGYSKLACRLFCTQERGRH